MSKNVSIKTIAITALLITAILLFSILLLARLLNNERQDSVSTEIQRTYNSLNEMQMFLLMSQTYGNDMACIAFTQKLQDLDKTVWNLGITLDRYRVASEELRKSVFYEDQKKTFNDQQLIYMLLLKNLQQKCDTSQVLIAFFYQNTDACDKCEDQSFVLTDINKDFDPDIAIFSYDVDLNLTSVNLLKEYYKVDSFPCVVIDDVPFCGMRDKDFIIEKICERNPDIPECPTRDQTEGTA